jgi:hypothetical protein
MCKLTKLLRAVFTVGVTLLNTSRGGLVDTDALLDGLRSFQVRETGWSQRRLIERQGIILSTPLNEPHLVPQVGAYGMDVYENESELFFRDFSQMDMKSKLQHWDSKFQELMVRGFAALRAAEPGLTPTGVGSSDFTNDFAWLWVSNSGLVGKLFVLPAGALQCRFRIALYACIGVNSQFCSMPA